MGQAWVFTRFSVKNYIPKERKTCTNPKASYRNVQITSLWWMMDWLTICMDSL